MQLGEAVLKLRADGSGLESDVEAAGQRASGKLRSIFAGAAIGAALKSSIDAASGLEQAVGGTAAVFGEASGAVDEFAANSAQALGLSERAYRELTSTLGGLLQSMGFTREESAGLANDLATLGADLSATFGGSTEEAVTAIGAALRGERDPIERYGIAFNEAAVQAKAMELGLVSAGGSIDANAKAQATLALITEQSAGAQGQFARESDTAAGAQARAAAEAENASASLGSNFLPVYERITSVVGSLASGFGALPGPVQTVIVAMAGLAALSGPIGFLKDLGSTILPVARVALDKVAVGAYSVAGNLGTVGLAAGGLAAGLGILAAAYVGIQANQQAAADRQEEYTAILERQTEVGEAATQAALAQTIQDRVAIDNAQRLGIGIEQITDAITGQGDAWDRLRSTREGLEEQTDLTQDEQQLLAIIDQIEDQREALLGAQAAQEGSNEAAAEGQEVQEALGGAVALTAEQIDELTSALDILLGTFLDVPGAARDLAASFDEAFQTLLENGPTAFNDISEAGRENRDVLDGIVESTKAVVDAQVEQGASGIAVATTIQLQRDALAQASEQGLITTETFQFYDGVLRGMLTTVETQFQQPGLVEGTSAVINFRSQVLGIPPERQTAVFADTALAQSRIDEFNERLRGIPRIIDVKANFVGALNGFAEGTPSAPPGVALVGEEGPELVVFRGGERVLTAGETAGVMAAGGAGGGGGESTGAIEAAVERGIERGLARAHLTVEVADVATSIRRRENGQRRYPR